MLILLHVYSHNANERKSLYHKANFLFIEQKQVEWDLQIRWHIKKNCK